MKNDYEKESSIDVLALDVEWIHQPGRFMKYAEKQASAKRELDELKQELKVLESELLLQAAEEGEELIGSKPTVAVVDAWVKSNKRHIEASKEIIQKDYELNILQSAVRAFDQRKSALENLVRLWQGSYFSGPREPKDYSAVDGVVEQVRPKRKKK